eukprot:TRINITY_DN16248_c0_g1_i1.p1 TRINITY_DN16248_c0_g1~~TRINITY_DN16248_c0_g1_i1.p1  ORF type:complete len:449 (+),score=111.13 TRINITY_DN16248_c0_g1_i1:56-1402(+)
MRSGVALLAAAAAAQPRDPCDSGRMTAEEAALCPVDLTRRPARVSFVACDKHALPSSIGRRKGQASRKLLSLGRDLLRQKMSFASSTPGRKRPSSYMSGGASPPRSYVSATQIQTMVDAYGGAWLATASVFADTHFDASRAWWGDAAALEGPSFTLLMDKRLRTLKTKRTTDFWVRHLSWYDRLLTMPPVSCAPPNGSASGSEWDACLQLFRQQQTDALALPDPVVTREDRVAVSGTVSILPFWWSPSGCQVDPDARHHTRCFRSGRVTTPEEQLRMLRAAVRRHNSYFGGGTVVGVCDAAGAQAVRDALAGETLLEVPELHCDAQGPDSFPDLRGGKALPWLLLEHAQRSLRRWGATRVLYNEPDQILHFTNMRAVFAGLSRTTYIVPHRLEEWPAGEFRIAGRTVTVPLPKGARAFNVSGKLLLATTAGTAHNCGRKRIPRKLVLV